MDMKSNSILKLGLKSLVLSLIGLLIIFTSCQEDEEVFDVPVDFITIKGDFIEDGGTSQLTAEISPENATVKVVEWEVSNEAVATIDQNGVLTAVSNGVLTVTVSATDGSGATASKSFSVSGVKAPQVDVENITIRATNITDGQAKQLSVDILPTNATNKVVVWSVSDETIAEISESGLLTPKDNGTITISATATDNSGISDSQSITISGVENIVFVTSISISGTDIADGSAQQLSAQVMPENATNNSLDWSVSNDAIATVSETGLLTPTENGTVVVTATARDGSGVKDEITIVVSGVNGELDGIIVASSSEILSALSSASAGDKIYIRGGNYAFNSTVDMSRDGTSGNMISLLAYPNDSSRPVFDFSAMSENSSNRGVSLSGDYWHIKGIDFYGAGDNGMFIRGNHNFIEFCSFYENADTGLQIGNGAAQNTVLNCDSYYNADSSLENADGFAAKLDCGSGNKFIGCRAWNNLDDGWDGYLRGADNVSTYYENCWAIRNGYLKTGAVGAGDGNGFKTGGSDNKDLKHNAEYRNCIAAGNVFDGFDHNSNRGSILIYHASAHANGRNFSFGTGNIASALTVKNSLSLASGSNDQFNATTTDITNNGWQNGLSTSADDFSSLAIEQMLQPRKADGSLPDLTYLHLITGSDLIDAGVDVGVPFNGTAPDLGAFESQ
ncbi:MAG: Ig-like domain-containing protein [Cyclobacteriaceae bacterium]